MKNVAHRKTRIFVPSLVAPVLFILSLIPALLHAQTPASDRPIPILTGTAGYFTFVTAGQTQLNVQVNPVLLLPLESAGWSNPEQSFKGHFSGRLTADRTAVR